MTNDKFGKPIKIEDDFAAKNSTTTDFEFRVWCKQTGYIQNQPWTISQLIAQDMQEAARMFVEEYDKTRNDMFFAKNWNKIKNMIIWVQDWRGRIRKFEVIVETRPHYIARRIK